MVGVMESPHLVRLGLSHAALKAAILTELEDGGVQADAEVIASAVADALDTNNQELFRQLRGLLGPQTDEVVGIAGPEPDRDP
jgi:hypothetical protein